MSTSARSASASGCSSRPPCTRSPPTWRTDLTSEPGPDWAALRAAARAAAAHAYAPYSQFPVGAAGLVDDGRVVSGCNVENASYGLALCAECGVVSALVSGGGGRLLALACVDGAGAALMPCGRCRQLLFEHGGPGCLVDSPAGPRRLGELLPDAFTLRA